MKSLKVFALPLIAILASGCYGKTGNVGDVLFAGAIAGVAIASAVHDANVAHERALERERDPGPYGQRVYVVTRYENAPPRRATAEPPPPPPPFDAKRARAALSEVDLTACREAGAPRGYGHAKATINPSGDISKVVIDEPSGMPPAAVKCVGDALGTATVPEFSGNLVTVGTTWFVP